jgi:hypothetical protein
MKDSEALAKGAVILLAAAIFYILAQFVFQPPPSPRSYDFCQFQVGLQCSSWRLSAYNNTVWFSIINGYQQEIKITSATCQAQGVMGTWKQYSPPITILAQQSVKLTIDNLYDGAGNKMNFEPGDTFTGKCVVEYYFTSEGPKLTRRNTADVKFTAQP